MHSDWETNFFQGIALDAWRHAAANFLDTAAEAEFLARVVGGKPGAALLDVPCGNGRHALELARRGFQVTGVDLSGEFLAEGRSNSKSVHWVEGDMRRLDFAAEFDGAYCFGNSFGYLDAEEALAFLSGAARSLRPGGHFALETGMAAESILPTLVRNRWMRLGDVLMLSQNQYCAAESRLDIEYTFIRGEQAETRPSASYVFTVAEIGRIHRAAGLNVKELLASINGDAYQLGSQRLIVVSQR